MNSCANCRYHRAELRPKPIDAAFDTVVAFEDEDQKFYFCMAKSGPFAGKDVGFSAVLCEEYEAAETTTQKSELDKLMARFEQRNKNKDNNGDEGDR